MCGVGRVEGLLRSATGWTYCPGCARSPRSSVGAGNSSWFHCWPPLHVSQSEKDQRKPQSSAPLTGPSRRDLHPINSACGLKWPGFLILMNLVISEQNHRASSLRPYWRAVTSH